MDKRKKCLFKKGDWARSWGGALVKIIESPYLLNGTCWVAKVQYQDKEINDLVDIHSVGDWQKGDWIKSLKGNRLFKVGDNLLSWVNDNYKDFIPAEPEDIDGEYPEKDRYMRKTRLQEPNFQVSTELAIKNINRRLNALEDSKNEVQTGVCAKAVPAIICEICRSNYPGRHQKRGYETGSCMSCPVLDYLITEANYTSKYSPVHPDVDFIDYVKSVFPKKKG